MIPISIFKPKPKREAPIFKKSGGVIDVIGDLDLRGQELKILPATYGIVTGHCLLNGNKLISLKGSPRRVGGGFYCFMNELTSLDGCPDLVGGDFSAGHNKAEFTIEEIGAKCKIKGNIYE